MIKIRTCLLWFAMTAAHTYLFYRNSTGVNALVFSLLIVAVVTWYHGLLKEKFWLLAATGHLIIAVGAALHARWSDIAAYNISFVVLAGFVFSARSSLWVAFVNGLIGSFLFSFLQAIMNGLKFAQEILLTPHHALFSLKKMPLYVAPVSVTLIFYMLYGAANPDFFLDVTFPAWELDFELIAYIGFGAIIICPLVFSYGIDRLTEWDVKQPDRLYRIRVKRQMGTPLGLFYENKQAVIMFVMLNALIILFLAFNIIQIFVPTLNHSAADFSQQVHQGFETLVISLIVAILLIMYYFRANQNFYGRKERLVKLASLWIALNGILILFTCYKNILYIDSFGLTYKRIWVFIGMLLTGIGLYLTLLKIYRLKTNWYLLRQNAWVLYCVIAFYGTANWDRLITWYNPNYASNLDMGYIMSLGNSQLPYLNELLLANDPRVIPYEKDIKYKISAVKISSKWQEMTWDDIWLQKELASK
jgi:hypothetical protein